MTESTFIHQHSEFDALLSIVSDRRGVSTALVGKDYWVTHVLWALESNGFRVWFKGGTSLSKGFGLIERFSEDLDLKIEAPNLPRVQNWKSEEKGPTTRRRQFFDALGGALQVPGAQVKEVAALRDPSWRSTVYSVRYPGRFVKHLPGHVRPYVQIDVGSARVNPCEEAPITSWVHDYIMAEAPYVAVLDNRPQKIHCVRPEVTLLEKIEAISRRYARNPYEPATFVRHYEDAVRILSTPVGVSDDALQILLAEMIETGDIRAWPSPDDPAFNPAADDARWNGLAAAWDAIAPMFWGERVPIRVCAAEIRALLAALAK